MSSEFVTLRDTQLKVSMKEKTKVGLRNSHRLFRKLVHSIVSFFLPAECSWRELRTEKRCLYGEVLLTPRVPPSATGEESHAWQRAFRQLSEEPANQEAWWRINQPARVPKKKTNASDHPCPRRCCFGVSCYLSLQSHLDGEAPGMVVTDAPDA